MKFNQKFSILFWLPRHKQNKEGLIPIYARITVDGVRAELAIKRSIHPDHWDTERGLAKDSYYEAPVLNEFLLLVHAELGKNYNILLSTQDERVTAEQVKASYQGEYAKFKKGKRKSFLHVFKIYLDRLKEKVEVKDLGKGRYKRFEVLYNKVHAYIKVKYKKDVDPAELRLNFIVGFAHFLRTVHKISNNTTMKYAKDLKQVMTFITIEEDLHHNPFQSFKCKLNKVKRKFLDQDELDAIEKKHFELARLREVRDVFVFSCYTGYAYSDVAALQPKNLGKGIDGSLWLIRDRGKTGTVENVPLLPKALEIIERYKDHPYCKAFNKLLPVNSNVKYNAYLKEIADLCGIDKLLTTHVARHTCATTVLLSNDVSMETTMEFLGHSDIRTTQIYGKIVQKKLGKDVKELSQRLEANSNL